jgi:ankyrin repeat protein
VEWIRANNYEGVKQILEVYTDNDRKYLNRLDSKLGKTGLMCAAEDNQVDFMQLLLEYNLKIDVPSRNGNSALHFASHLGAVDG